MPVIEFQIRQVLFSTCDVEIAPDCFKQIKARYESIYRLA